MELILTKEDMVKIAENLLRIDPENSLAEWVLDRGFKLEDHLEESKDRNIVVRIIDTIGAMAAELEGVDKDRWGLSLIDGYLSKQQTGYHIAKIGELLAYAIERFVNGEFPLLPQLNPDKRDKRKAMRAQIRKREEEEGE